MIDQKIIDSEARSMTNQLDVLKIHNVVDHIETREKQIQRENIERYSRQENKKERLTYRDIKI